MFALSVFPALFPIYYLPSDDQVFAELIAQNANCIAAQIFCWPSPYHEFTKPFFIWLGALTHLSIGRSSLNLTPLESMVLLGQCSMALTGALIQRQILWATGQRQVWPVAVGFAIYWSNPTVWGAQLWWGYSHLLALLVALALDIGFRYGVRREHNLRHRQRLTAGAHLSYLIPISLLFVGAIYTHLAAIPFVLAAIGVFALFWLSIDYRLHHGTIQGVRWIKVLLGPVTVVLPLIALTMLGIATITYGFEHGQGYLDAYAKNLEHNANATLFLRQQMTLLFYLTIAIYFLLAELPTMALLGGALPLLWLRFRRDAAAMIEYPGWILVAGHAIFFVVTVIGISLSNSTKLLRSFYPAQPSLILLSSLAAVWLIMQFRVSLRPAFRFATLTIGTLFFIAYAWNSVGVISCTVGFRRDLPAFVETLFRDASRNEYPGARLLGFREEPWMIGNNAYFRKYVGDDRSEYYESYDDVVRSVKPRDYLLTTRDDLGHMGLGWIYIDQMQFHDCNRSFADIYANEYVTVAFLSRTFGGPRALDQFEHVFRNYRLPAPVTLYLYQRVPQPEGG